jgi:hypothetical protein
LLTGLPSAMAASSQDIDFNKVIINLRRFATEK